MSNLFRPILQPVLRPLTVAILDWIDTSFNLYAAIINDAGELAPYVTFTRSSTATRYNSAGLLETVAANAPRYDYDPTTVTRANLFTFSEFQNGVTDAPTRGGFVSAASFSGLFSATGLAFGHDGVTISFAYKNGAVTGVTYCFSAYVQMDDGGAPVFGSGTQTDPENTFAIVIGGNIVSPLAYTVTNIGNGLYRVSGSHVAGANAANSGIVKYPTNNNRTFKVSGYQLEAGTTATDYIPTGVLERGIEQVVNGDNEAALYSFGTGPTGANVTISRVNEVGRNCAKAISTVGTSVTHQVTHGISIPAGMAIEVSVDVYIPTGGVAQFAIYDGSDGSFFSQFVTTQNSWQTIRITRPAKSTVWDLRVGNNAAEIITTSATAYYFDNFSVRQINSDFNSPRGNATLRGLLIEEQRTNFYNSSNSYIAGTGTTITAAAAVAPDGTLTASRFAKTDATTPRYQASATTMTVAANAAYTVSRCFKYDGFDTTVSLEYNNADNWGAITWVALFNVTSSGVTVSSQQSCTASVQNIGNGWYRAIATFTTAATIGTPTNPQTLTRIVGASGVSVLMSHAQIEAGAFATSYIPTTTAAVTRAADVASVSSLSSIGYNSAEGTIFAEFDFAGADSNASANNRVAISIDNGGNNERLYIYNISPGIGGLCQNGGATQAAPVISGTVAVDQAVRAAFGFSANNFNAARNGALGVNDSNGLMPASVDRLSIGRGGNNGGYLNGHVRRARYYPRRLTNAQLQALTA